MEHFVNKICCAKEDHFCPVFISFRVAEASKEAALLQDVLAKHGVGAYVCNAGHTKLGMGENWEDSITEALHRCTLLIVLGTKTYGAEGTETIDTKKELAFAIREKKDIVVLKMTDSYVAPYAIMQLPSLQSIQWTKGQPLPQGVLEYVLGRVQRDDAIAEKSSKHHLSQGGGAPEEQPYTGPPEVVVMMDRAAARPLAAADNGAATITTARTTPAEEPQQQQQQH